MLLEHKVFEKVPVLLKGRENFKGINFDRRAIEKVPVLLKDRDTTLSIICRITNSYKFVRYSIYPVGCGLI